MDFAVSPEQWAAAAEPFRTPARARKWRGRLTFLLGGYSLLGRTFAHVGILPAKIFIGEIMLAWFLLTNLRAFDWMFRSARKNRATEFLTLGLVLFWLQGIFSVVYGYMEDNSPLVAGQNLAFNYYSAYLVMGVALGAVFVAPLGTILYRIAWLHGIYGTAYVLLLTRLEWVIPGTDVVLFGQPNAAATSVLALLCFSPRNRVSWIPMLLNLFTLAALQVRAEWLAFGLALMCWALIARRFGKLFPLIALAAVLLVVGVVFDIRLPSPSGRGGELSVQGMVGRVLAPFDAAAADKYVEDAEGLGGTLEWRKRWWTAIWASINSDADERFFFGHGYGFPITDLVAHVEEGVRTPHNIFFFALAYGGWVGVSVFVLFQASLGFALRRAYRLTHQPFGFCYWIMSCVGACFGNSFESPFGAIPFYLICGMALAPIFVPASQLQRWGGEPSLSPDGQWATIPAARKPRWAAKLTGVK